MPDTIRTRPYTIDRKAYFTIIWSRCLVRFLSIFGVAALLILAGLALKFGSAPLVGGIPVIAFYVLLIVAVRYFATKRVIYRSDMNKVFDDPRMVEFSDEGLHVQTEGGVESRFPWTHLVSAQKRGPFMLLFQTKIIHYIVPDDAFESEADRAALWQMIEKKGLVKVN